MRVRILPAGALALGLLLALKMAGLGEEGWALLGAGQAWAEEKAAAEELPAPEESHEAAPAPEEAHSETALPPQMASGPTASESDVLERLAQRREQLDAREREIDMREKVLGAAEKRIEERIAELKTIEGRIEAMFGKRDEQEEKQLSDLVKMYETMKPVSAAAIFDTLEQGVLIDVIRRMKPAKASPVLAAMKPDRAREVTVELARIEALPSTTPPVAAAPAGG